MLRERAGLLSGIKSAELRLRLPVQLQRDLHRPRGGRFDSLLLLAPQRQADGENQERAAKARRREDRREGNAWLGTHENDAFFLHKKINSSSRLRGSYFPSKVANTPSGNAADFRPGEDQRARAFHHFVADLQPAIGGQAVQHHRVLRRGGEQLLVHLEPGEILHPPGLLGLLPHAHPGVGVDHIGVRTASADRRGFKIHLRHLRMIRSTSSSGSS
jgi:hypothetical protein